MLRANIKRPVKQPSHPGTVHPIVATEIIVLSRFLKGRTALTNYISRSKIARPHNQMVEKVRYPAIERYMATTDGARHAEDLR